MHCIHFLLLLGVVFLTPSSAGSMQSDDSDDTDRARYEYKPSRRIKPINVRKSVSTLTRQERTKLADAIVKMKTVPSQYDSKYNAYDYFVVLHNIRSDPFGPYSAHLGTRFFPWHREFVFRFNEELKRVSGDASMEMPYWLPSDLVAQDILFNDLEFVGGNGRPITEGRLKCGSFNVSYIDTVKNGCLNRNVGGGIQVTLGNVTNAYGLFPPTNSEFEKLLESFIPLDVPPYTAFNFTGAQYLKSFVAQVDGCDPTDPIPKNFFWFEGACVIRHGQMHVYTGDNLASSGSPNDPIFYAVHSFIDLVWALYQDKYGDASTPTVYLDGLIDGTWPITFRQTLDHRCRYGYKYDVQPDRRPSTVLPGSNNGCAQVPKPPRPPRVPSLSEKMALKIVSKLFRQISYGMVNADSLRFGEFAMKKMCSQVYVSNYLGSDMASMVSPQMFGAGPNGFIEQSTQVYGRPNQLFFISSSTYDYDFVLDETTLDLGVTFRLIVGGTSSSVDGLYRFVFRFEGSKWCLKKFFKKLPQMHAQPVVINLN